LTFYFATEEERAELLNPYNFREELMFEVAADMRITLSETYNFSFETEDEFYATFMPIFDQKWEEFQVSEDAEDWSGTWELLWEPLLEEYDALYDIFPENFNHGDDFNWDDWRSNFEITGDRWWLNYDLSFIFSNPVEHEGTEFWCDGENNCFTLFEDTDEVCDIEWNCYNVEEALRTYFDGYNWNYGADFNWADWESNFDMNSDRWFANYDFSVIFPNPIEHEGTEFWCDGEENCFTFIQDTNEVCDIEGNCYNVEEALRIYFDGYNWNYGQDFDFEDWESNFDMS